jgi:biopolymer transport protein ExbD
MITRPLDLESRLSPPPRDFTAVAWVNVGVIALFFSLLGSQFVLAPGLLIELPEADAASITAVPTTAVVTYDRENVIMFEGGIYTLAELRGHLEAYARKHPGAVLQMNADKQLSAQAFADLSAMAKAVGFSSLLMAAKPSAQAVPEQ